MSDKLPGPRVSIYPGWFVLAAGFLCSLLAVGGTHYVYGVYLVPISEEFAISRSIGNSGMIALMVGLAIWSPLVGRCLDRFRVRWVMALGAVSVAAAFLTLSTAPSVLWFPTVIAGPLAFGVCACGSLAANTVVVRWFGSRRGRALGILAVSTSLGGFIMAPSAAFFIDMLGWRQAMLVQGAIMSGLMLCMALFVIRNQPQGSESGYSLEFEAAHSEQADWQNGTPAWAFSDLLRNSQFWMMTLGLGLLFGSDQALLISKVPYFVDIGLSLQQAAALAGLMTLSAIGGKLVVGYLADTWDLRHLYFLVVLCHVLLLSVFILQPNYIVLAISAGVLGLAVGGVYPVWMTLIASHFGSSGYGTVMGLMVILMKPTAIALLYASGALFDHYGSYQWAFVLLLICVAVSCVFIQSLGRPTSLRGRNLAPSGAGL